MMPGSIRLMRVIWHSMASGLLFPVAFGWFDSAVVVGVDRTGLSGQARMVLCGRCCWAGWDCWVWHGLARNGLRNMAILLMGKIPMAGLFLAFEWHLVWAAASGMETILYAAAILFVFWQLAEKGGGLAD